MSPSKVEKKVKGVIMRASIEGVTDFSIDFEVTPLELIKSIAIKHGAYCDFINGDIVIQCRVNDWKAQDHDPVKAAKIRAELETIFSV